MCPFSNNKVPQIKELGSNGAGIPATRAWHMPLTSSVSLDPPSLPYNYILFYPANESVQIIVTSLPQAVLRCRCGGAGITWIQQYIT